MYFVERFHLKIFRKNFNILQIKEISQEPSKFFLLFLRINYTSTRLTHKIRY